MRSIRLTLISLMASLAIVCSRDSAAREISKEALVFREKRDAVVTVFGDRGHGSGFFVNGESLILTNSHVIAQSSRISVQLDPTTRIPAILLAEDEQKDIAVLCVSREFVKELPSLRLATRTIDDLAFEGEKVIAIGSPLHQTRIVTSGIVSKVEEEAIITDVNLNPGNSGGPLINLDSEVIAVNTFRDPSLGGSGLSGSVPILLAMPLLEQARNELERGQQQPPPVLLPVAPQESFPLEALEWGAERSGKGSNYELRSTWIRPSGASGRESYFDSGFEIQVVTPPRQHFLETAAIKRLAKKRRGREAAAGVPASEMYDPVGARLKRWREYVGDYSPVVTISIQPKIGQTSGSVLLNMLGAAAAGYAGTPYYGSYNYEFKADLQDATLMDGASSVPEVLRAMGMMPISVSERSVSMEDIAQRGILVFRPEVFESRDLYLRIQDLKRPDQTIHVPVSPACREQILVDFEPYMDLQRAKDARLRLKSE